MYDCDFDEMAMEAHLFPWLDSDCMADPCTDDDPWGAWVDGEDD